MFWSPLLKDYRTNLRQVGVRRHELIPVRISVASLLLSSLLTSLNYLICIRIKWITIGQGRLQCGSKTSYGGRTVCGA